jgi:hypothetical protein
MGDRRMNGKVARELRKIADFKPHEKRDYETWTVGTKIGTIFRILEDGNVELTDREIECTVIECVSPERKIYRELKRKFSQFKLTGEVNLQFNEMPDKKFMEDLLEKAHKENSNE